MNIEQKIQDSVAIITLRGNVNSCASYQIKKAFYKLFHAGYKRLIIDFNKVDNVDVGVLSTLVDVLHQLRAQQGDLALLHLSQKVEHILEITQLDQLFWICNQQSEALAYLQGVD